MCLLSLQVVLFHALQAAGSLKVSCITCCSRVFDLRKATGLLLLADVVPDVRIEGGDGRRRADPADHVLAALGADLDLLDRSRWWRKAALVDDRFSGRERKDARAANKDKRDGATHGRVLRSVERGCNNMSSRGPGVNRARRPRGEYRVSPQASPMKNLPPPSTGVRANGRVRRNCSRRAVSPTRSTDISIRWRCTQHWSSNA